MYKYKIKDTTSATNPLTYDKFQEDLNYIKDDVITLLPNGKYMKYSRLLKAVSVLEFIKDDYIRFWKTRYMRNGKHTIFYNDIVKEAENKIESGLTPLETMLELIKNSHDDTSDKVKALKLLKGK